MSSQARLRILKEVYNMKKENILLITLEYVPFKGGIARYMEGFVSMFPEDQITILVHDENEGRNGNVIRKNLLYKYKYPRWAKALLVARQLIKEEKYTLIVTPHILPLGMVCKLIKKYYDVPYIISLHGKDILLAEKSNRKRKHAIEILLNAKGIIANSNFTRGEVSRIISPEKRNINVLHPGSPQIFRTKEKPKNIRKKYNIHEDAPVLITVSRLDKRKGIDLVLEAMVKLVKVYPDLLYIVIGSGKERSNLHHQATKLSLRNNIKFIDKVDDDTLADYYSISDIFVMPARRIGADVEGFGIVYLEAGFFSLPVIGTKTGGINDAIVHEKTGLLIRENDSKAVFASIDRLLSDKNWRVRMGEAGKKHSGQFTWEHNRNYFDVWYRGLR